jgi:hypothetical protein
MSNIKKQLKVAIQIARKAEIEALIATEKAQKAIKKIAKLKKELDAQHKKLAKKIKKNKKASDKKIKKNKKDNDKKIKHFSKKKVKKAKKVKKKKNKNKSLK